VQAYGGCGLTGQRIGRPSENEVAARGFHPAQDIVRGQADQGLRALRAGGENHHTEEAGLRSRDALF